MTRRRPCFRDPRLAVAIGVAAGALAWFCLWDAFQRRGQPTPRPLRPFTAPFS
jgi:hypothetical protein